MSSVVESSSSPYNQLLAACEAIPTIEALRTVAHELGAKQQPIGFSITAPGYAHSALDIAIQGNEGYRRIFIHENFADDATDTGESILTSSGLTPLPIEVSGEHFTAHELPMTAYRLLDHRMTRPNADSVSRLFLVPALQQLFRNHAVIPTGETLDNIVHTEEIDNDPITQSIQTRMLFVPPYAFEPVTADTFVPAVAQNISSYGPLVTERVCRLLAA